MYFCSGNNNLKLFITLILPLVLFGCANQVAMDLPNAIELPAHKQGSNSLDASMLDQEAVHEKTGIKNLNFEHLSPQLKEGNVVSHRFPEGDLFINADKMPLNQFIHTTLGELLNFTISVDPVVASRNDPVTLNVAKPVEPEILLGMVEEALQLLNVGLIISPSGIMKVVPKAELLKSPPQLLASGSLLTQGQVIAFIPLEYADINETLLFSQAIFELGLHGRAMYNERLGAIMVVGTNERVKRFQSLIAALDKPSLKERTIRLIEPEYWQVDDLVEMLTKLLGAQSIPVYNKKTRKAGLQFIVLDKINSLVVVSPKEQWAEFVVDTVKKIDSPSAKGDGNSHFVYFVKNTRAEELGAIISSVLSPSTVQGDGQSASGATDQSTSRASGKGDVAADRSNMALLHGKLKVIPDLQRNALIFVGSGKDYEDVLPLLKQLDIPAKQVLIEVTIAEITLDNSSQLGTEWSLDDLTGKTLSTIGGLGVGGGGITFTEIDNRGIGDVFIRLNALAKTGKAKILSSPRLLAMDNEEAKIQVGTQIAILSKEVTDSDSVNDGSTVFVRTFNYVDTGVILSVTPSINEGGVVRLDLSQEVSETPQVAGDTPPIFKRSIETSLLTKSGQTIMIGGLISNTEGETINKVPLLGDIPWLGTLFSNKELIEKSTELIVLVTPYIISNSDDADYYTKAFRDQLGWE